jgi:hypothetical protein
MKYIILIAVLFLVLNCALQVPVSDLSNWDNITDNQIPGELKNINYDLNKNDACITKVYNWACYHIDYKLYAFGFHETQRTLSEMKGNCANLSLVVLNLVNKLFNIKGDLVWCQLKDYSWHYTVKFGSYYPEEDSIYFIDKIIKYDDIANYILYLQ